MLFVLDGIGLDKNDGFIHHLLCSVVYSQLLMIYIL
jgi:hypothetical protein